MEKTLKTKNVKTSDEDKPKTEDATNYHFIMNTTTSYSHRL